MSSWLSRAVDGFFKFLLGDDIFISYSRADGATYAAGLANMLAKRGFSCRIDQWGTESGSEMPKSLKKALRRSTALVLVGTEGAARSRHVAEEVRELKRLRRLIIPIVFEGVLLRNGFTPQGEALVHVTILPEEDPRRQPKEEASWAKDIEGQSVFCEKRETLRTGEPSPAALDRIEKACTFWRRDKRLGITTAGVAALLIFLISASVWAGNVAIKKGDEARRKTAETARMTQKAEAAAERARKAGEKADHAEEVAAQKTRLADDAIKKADEQTRLADAAGRRASAAAAAADKQQGIAVGWLTASNAEFSRNQFLAMDKKWAGMLQKSVLLAIEAANRLSARGIPPADSDQPLRYSLSQLPRSVQKLEHQHGIDDAMLTSDGRYLITKEDDGFLRVWETAEHKQVSADIELNESITFNRERTLLAMVSKDGHLSVLQLPQGKPLWQEKSTVEYDPDYDFLQFSPDGKNLAMSVSSADLRGSAEPSSGSIVVWNARDGQKLTEVKYEGFLESMALSSVDGLLALSLTRPVEGSDATTQEEQQEENLLQIWTLQNPPVAFLPETRIAPREILKNDEVPIYFPLTLLTFGPDGRFLAASTGYHATILEAKSGKEVTYIAGPDRDPRQQVEELREEISQLEFSADGERLGTMGDRGTGQTWDVLTGKHLPTQSLREVRDIKYAGQAPSYMVTNEDGGVSVVDFVAGKEVARVLLDERAWLGDYAPEGERLVLYDGKAAWLYDTGSAQEVARVSYPGRTDIRSSNISSDGRYVALTSGPIVTVLDVINARNIARLEHASKVDPDHVAVSAGAQYVATVSWDEKLHVWKTDTAQEVWNEEMAGIRGIDEDYSEEVWSVGSLYFSPCGKFLVVEESHLEIGGVIIHIWDVNKRRKVASTRYSATSNAAFSTNSEVLFTSDDKYVSFPAGDEVRVVDTESNRKVATVLQEESAQKVIFSPDKKLMARARKGAVEVLEILGGCEIYKIPLGGDRLEYAFSPDGKYLAAIGGKLRSIGEIREAGTGRLVASLDIEKQVSELASKLAFSPSGRYLYLKSQAWNEKSDLIIWENLSGRELLRYVNDGIISDVVFNPTERHIAVSSLRKRVVRVLAIMDNGHKEADLLSGGPVDVLGLTFSLDGRFFAARSGGTAHVWETGSWREIARLRHERDILNAKFIPGKNQLATVSEDLTARVWLLDERELIARACGSLTRNLSPEEWADNFVGEERRITCPKLQLERLALTSSQSLSYTRQTGPAHSSLHSNQ